MFIRKLGIDLGTCNSLVFVPKKGIVLQEPSVVAISIDDNRILAVGADAKAMTGRTPDTIQVYRPLREGVIADYRVTQAMLRHFMERTLGRFRFLKPELMIAVPAGITSTERRAVIEGATSAGARAAYTAKEPILAAIGAGIPINSYAGHMIIDIGGGTSEVAIIALGGIVVSASVRVAGDKFDTAIADYIKKKHGLAIGEQTAEEIKVRIGTALPDKDPKYYEIRGRDLMTGLPKTIKISSNEVSEAIQGQLEEIMQAIKLVLKDAPPELSADIMDRGMVISGGGALLRNIDGFIAKSTGVPCFVAEDALSCVAKGAGVVLENLEPYKKSIMSKK